jgi:hypothetical protein
MLENQFATCPRFGGFVMTALATGNAHRRSFPAGAGYWSSAGRFFQWRIFNCEILHAKGAMKV